jgi:hypothetical protein
MPVLLSISVAIEVPSLCDPDVPSLDIAFPRTLEIFTNHANEICLCVPAQMWSKAVSAET